MQKFIWYMRYKTSKVNLSLFQYTRSCEASWYNKDPPYLQISTIVQARDTNMAQGCRDLEVPGEQVEVNNIASAGTGSRGWR